MKVIFWGLVIVALCYGAYSGMMAAWSWIAVNNAVDEIISKQGVEAIPAAELKTKVLNASSQAGVSLDERSVNISRQDRGGVQIEVVWTIPVIVMKSEPVLAIPLAVRRRSAGADR
jgi:hypothetical protein